MCEKCKNRGWIFYEKDGYEYARECECRELEKAKTRLNNSGISEEFSKKNLTNFNDKGLEVLIKAKKIATDYLEKFPEIKNTRNNSVLYMGQVGSGKTHLSMAICNNLMDYYKTSVIYMSYREEITRIKQNIKDEQQYKEAIERFQKCPVLMIDDLLKGKNTEADENILFEIINYRYLNNLPMIVSTEKTLDELLNFDEGIMSRLIEMSRGHSIEIIGQQYNYRLSSSR